jgi:Xaa-Pro aminopeptidase
VHDFPERISATNNFVFKKGMVFSIEPAYYKKNWGGIRIEDNIVVTATGTKRLSRASKDLIEI